MKSIRRILVAVDLSKHSTAALDWAIAFAREIGAEIELVHCYEISPLVSAYGERFPDTYDAALRRAAGSGLSDQAHRVAAAGVRVREHLVKGDPSQEILECARQVGAELIAIGTRGASGLEHLLLGSVAERVIRRAPCPVVAVRSEARP